MLEASRLKDIDFLREYTEVAGNTSSLSYLRNDRPVLCCIVHLFIRKSLKYDDDFVVSDADKPKIPLTMMSSHVVYLWAVALIELLQQVSYEGKCGGSLPAPC